MKIFFINHLKSNFFYELDCSSYFYHSFRKECKVIKSNITDAVPDPSLKRDLIILERKLLILQTGK